MVLHNGSLRVYDVPQCGAAYTLAQLQNVFAAHAVEWNLMGRDRPWWSVLSVAEYDQGTAPSENTIRTFYESGRKHVDRVLADLHLAPPLHDMRVLDVGCGLGRLAHAFARLGAAVACVDQSWNHLRLAQKQAYKRLAAADARRIEHLVTSPDLIASVGGRRYDVVHSWIALQHAVAPLQAVFMQQMCDVLKSGGKGLLQIPFFTPVRSSCDLDKSIQKGGMQATGRPTRAHPTDPVRAIHRHFNTRSVLTLSCPTHLSRQMHYTPMDEIRHAFESRGCRVSVKNLGSRMARHRFALVNFSRP